MYEDQNGDWEFGADGGELAATLDIGDNFAINTGLENCEGADFQILSCTKSIHKVRKSFTNKWGGNFEEVEDVVVGKYYQKWGSSDSSYVLLKDSHIVYMYTPIQ